MARRVEDWLRQARKDLTHARVALKAEHYEWSCFAAQQAAEKALKAVYEALGGEGFGHSVTKLLRELPESGRSIESLLSKGRKLDKVYITSRYPNGFASGAPMDYFSEEDAREAVENAKAILSFAQKQISQQAKGDKQPTRNRE